MKTHISDKTLTMEITKCNSKVMLPVSALNPSIQEEKKKKANKKRLGFSFFRMYTHYVLNKQDHMISTKKAKIS